ncbi:disease resistance protein RGA5-like [Panicum virgatum]|uniref:disease resistance protein RGA5-like n=1 Tax=Panicum virgatum TaxID=38727 RepID=UPI0019D5E99C|nr:disease resistance protein RGA5-like [Panicum virgatum]
MEVATGALGTLIPKLGQLLLDEYNLQKGVKKDIKFLSRELESMHAALRSVGEVPREELKEQVKIWARDVRELSYHMEDIVDTFLVRVKGPKPPSKRSAKSFLKKMMGIVTKAKTRHEIGQEIKDIKERVKEVAERRDRYKVDAIKPGKILVDPRITALYTKATDLVGIDEAREELITRLTKGDDMSAQQQRVVSIVGFGGLGKTTLAKAVYDQLRVQFDCTAFVSVSQNPDLNKLLKNMLYELDKQKHANIHSTMLEEKHLIDLAREFLENKRYLIVIDDIWDIKPWGILQCSLLENSLKSIIITTTRILDVAEQIGVAISSNLYLMRALKSYSMEEYSAPKANALDNILRYLKRF